MKELLGRTARAFPLTFPSLFFSVPMVALWLSRWGLKSDSQSKKGIIFLGTGDGYATLWVLVSFLNSAWPKATLRLQDRLRERRKTRAGKAAFFSFLPLRNPFTNPSAHPDVSPRNFCCAHLKRFLWTSDLLHQWKKKSETVLLKLSGR